MLAGGALLLSVLLHGGALPEPQIGPGDGHVRWPDQCGTMLAAADERSTARSSAAAAVTFRTGLYPTTTVTLRKLSQSQCHAAADRVCWLVPKGGKHGIHGVGKGTRNLLDMTLLNDSPHLADYAVLLHLTAGVHFGIVCASGDASALDADPSKVAAPSGCFDAMNAKGSYGTRQECGCPAKDQGDSAPSQRLVIYGHGVVPLICAPPHELFKQALGAPVLYRLSAEEEVRRAAVRDALEELGQAGKGRAAAAGVTYLTEASFGSRRPAGSRPRTGRARAPRRAMAGKRRRRRAATCTTC